MPLKMSVEATDETSGSMSNFMTRLKIPESVVTQGGSDNSIRSQSCAPQTHQLALDMQLSLLSPFLVYLLYRYDKIGLGLLQGVFVLSSIMRYISTSNNNLSLIIYHGMTVSQLYRTANMLYSQALHRASPYILGVVIGYYLKKFRGTLDFPKPFVAIGWIAASCLGFLAIVTPSHLADRSYQYDVNEAAQYAALSPIAWSLSLGWTIVACHLGYGGKINEILCNRALIVFSRISYAVYLTQFLVFFYRVGTTRIPDTFSISGSFNTTEFIAIIIVSVILTLLFDLPMKEIKTILLEKSPATDVSTTEEQGEEAGEETEEVTEDTLLPEEGEDEAGEEEEEEHEPEEVVRGGEDEEEMNYPTQPLKRASRIHFDEDVEDMAFWESENRELERQRLQHKTADDFWEKDED